MASKGDRPEAGSARANLQRSVIVHRETPVDAPDSEEPLLVIDGHLVPSIAIRADVERHQGALVPRGIAVRRGRRRRAIGSARSGRPQNPRVHTSTRRRHRLPRRIFQSARERQAAQDGAHDPLPQVRRDARRARVRHRVQPHHRAVSSYHHVARRE